MGGEKGARPSRFCTWPSWTLREYCRELWRLESDSLISFMGVLIRSLTSFSSLEGTPASVTAFNSIFGVVNKMIILS